MRRPLVRYHGGKWRLAPWIISYIPEHRIYCEPFGGGASVLLRKPRSYAEVYNDLDKEIVNLFSVVRDQGENLQEQLYLTPFARDEFMLSYEKTSDPLEMARRTVVRSFMGFGSNSISISKTGFRANSHRSGTTPAKDWKNYAECFELLIERIRGVTIENKDAIEVMKAHDSENTVHYVDPPYMFETRSDGRADYKFELTDENHHDLADFLHTLKGTVILSGYESDLYNERYAGWQCVKKVSHTDHAIKKQECLWISGEQLQKELF